MNIFVGNLPYNFTDDDLRRLFAPFGEVSSARVAMDGDSGRARGFGFVEMPSTRQGEGAVVALDESQAHGRMIRANVARSRGRR